MSSFNQPAPINVDITPSLITSEGDLNSSEKTKESFKELSSVRTKDSPRRSSGSVTINPMQAARSPLTTIGNGNGNGNGPSSRSPSYVPSSNSTVNNSLGGSRPSSIVEMLSTPPPLVPETLSTTPPFKSLFNDAYSLNYSLTPTSALHPHSPASSSVSLNNLNNSSSLAINWQNIPLSDLIEEKNLIFIDGNEPIENGFQKLVDNNLTSIPVILSSSESSAESVPATDSDPYSNQDLDTCINDSLLTFDCSDINSYLLLLVSDFAPNDSILQEMVNNKTMSSLKEAHDLINMIKNESSQTHYDNNVPIKVPISFVSQLTPKNPFITYPEFEKLGKVVETLGSGSHRIAITSKDDSKNIIGMLSQRRLIRYIWKNARGRFKPLEKTLFEKNLKDLNIGSTNVITINGESTVLEAFIKMNKEFISSLAVVDNQNNLLGNISITDVKHITKTSQSYILFKNCIHFISVILNSRGLENGKDSYPIFHVNLNTSLRRTLAKLVATQAHRLWIVEPYDEFNVPISQNYGCASNDYLELRAGKLIGVVSLTDILGCFAKFAGRGDIDPTFARRQRRNSSSSITSLSSRSSRSSFDSRKR